MLKYKDITKLNKQEKQDKLKELRLELVKKNVAANKTSKTKTKEIKKAIARLLTCQKFQEISEHDQKLKEPKNKKFLTSLNTQTK